jgi:hypothetical protein
MLSFTRSVLVSAGLLACAATFGWASETWKPLFNGKDLTGWETWLGKPEPTVEVAGLPKGPDGKYSEPIGAQRDPLGVFRVTQVDGGPALHFSGQLFGTLTTKESFSNYHLRLQFKWGERRWAPRATAVRDSGLLYRIYGPSGISGGVWPPCIELQIQEHDCGDLWTIHARADVTARPKSGNQFAVYDPTQPLLEVARWEDVNSSRVIKQADHEKPFGEWNTIELICVGDESIHVVNGHVVLRVKQARDLAGEKILGAGPIALQTEGAEIFYRNVELRAINEVPAEFR